MTAWYWTLLEQSANFVEAMMLIVLLTKFFVPKSTRLWPRLLAILGIYAIIYLLNLINSPKLLNLIVYYGAGLLIEFLLFNGRLPSRILLPMLMVAFVTIAEVMAVGILQITSDANIVQMLENTPYRILGIIISKLLLIIMVIIAGYFSKKQNERIPLKYSSCILIVPIVSTVCILTISQFMLNSPGKPVDPFWFVFCSFGLLFVNLLIMFLFEGFMNYSHNQSKLQLMVQQSEMLNSHLRETNMLQEETHRIWHDMKNHFTVIQWMVKSKNYEKLEQYMQTLNETVTESMLKIQSGNSILDALLNPKAAEAKKYGIDVTINASVPPKLPIEDLDLNIVYSNAFDNAIEACKKLPGDQKRFITIDTCLKNDNLVLVIKNSFDGIVKSSGGELKTTKLDSGRHGIGIGNMKRAVEKYDGHIMTNFEENVFILSAVMYCNMNIEKAV